MRVAVYVPADAAARYRRRGEARVRRQGHEFVGIVDTPAAARVAITSGVADQVAADPAHAQDLVPWLLVLPPPGAHRPGGAAAGVLVVWELVRDHPVRASAALAGLAGAAGLVALPLLLAPDGEPGRLTEPPPPVVGPAREPGSSPTSGPRVATPAPPPPVGQPTGGGGSLPEQLVEPSPSPPPPVDLPPQPSPPPASPSPVPPPPSPSASPAPPPPPEDERCVLRLELLGIRVTVCN